MVSVVDPVFFDKAACVPVKKRQDFIINVPTLYLPIFLNISLKSPQHLLELRQEGGKAKEQINLENNEEITHRH